MTTWSSTDSDTTDRPCGIYDITRDADAHRQLAAMYDRYGPSGFAVRERAAASALEPGRH
jgi:hypothetical protein